MRRIVVSFALLSAFVASCGPSSDQIQTAIAETQAAIPTATVEPTATPKPLTGADLEPLFLQPGDLPDTFVVFQYKLDPEDWWPEPVLYRGVGIQYTEADGAVGWVEVGVFDPMVDEEKFAQMGGESGEPVEGLGDASGIVEETDGFFYAFQGVVVNEVIVVWRRCNYVVSAELLGGLDADMGATYARRLDERLAAVLCP